MALINYKKHPNLCAIVVLCFWSFASLVQTAVWFTFSSVDPDIVFSVIPQLSTYQLRVLLAWGSVPAIIGTIPATFVVERYGYAYAYYSTAICMIPLFFSCLLYGFVPESRDSFAAVVFLHVAAFINGLAVSFVMGACAAFASAWFDSRHRPAIITAVVTANGAGNLALYSAALLFVSETHPETFVRLLHISWGLILVVFIGVPFVPSDRNPRGFDPHCIAVVPADPWAPARTHFTAVPPEVGIFGPLASTSFLHDVRRRDSEADRSTGSLRSTRSLIRPPALDESLRRSSTSIGSGSVATPRRVGSVCTIPSTRFSLPRLPFVSRGASPFIAPDADHLILPCMPGGPDSARVHTAGRSPSVASVASRAHSSVARRGSAAGASQPLLPRAPTALSRGPPSLGARARAMSSGTAAGASVGTAAGGPGSATATPTHGGALMASSGSMAAGGGGPRVGTPTRIVNPATLAKLASLASRAAPGGGGAAGGGGGAPAGGVVSSSDDADGDAVGFAATTGAPPPLSSQTKKRRRAAAKAAKAAAKTAARGGSVGAGAGAGAGGTDPSQVTSPLVVPGAGAVGSPMDALPLQIFPPPSPTPSRASHRHILAATIGAVASHSITAVGTTPSSPVTPGAYAGGYDAFPHGPAPPGTSGGAHRFTSAHGTVPPLGSSMHGPSGTHAPTGAGSLTLGEAIVPLRCDTRSLRAGTGASLSGYYDDDGCDYGDDHAPLVVPHSPEDTSLWTAAVEVMIMLKKAFTNVPVLLVISGGGGAGSCLGLWSSSTPLIFSEGAGLSSCGFNSHASVEIGLVSMFSILVGAFAACILMSWFRRSYKVLLSSFLLVAFFACAFLTMVVDRPPCPASLRGVCELVPECSFSLVMAIAIVIGIVAGAASPLCVEMAVELVYPEHDTIASEMYTWMFNGVMVLFLFVPSGDGLYSLNLRTMIACAIGFSLTILTPMKYLRRQAAEAHASHHAAVTNYGSTYEEHYGYSN